MTSLVPRAFVGPGTIEIPIFQTRGVARCDLYLDINFAMWEAHRSLRLYAELDASFDGGRTWKKADAFMKSSGGPLGADEDGFIWAPGFRRLEISQGATHMRGRIELNEPHELGWILVKG